MQSFRGSKGVIFLDSREVVLHCVTYAYIVLGFLSKYSFQKYNIGSKYTFTNTPANIQLH
jgi:hypothetical protein